MLISRIIILDPCHKGWTIIFLSGGGGGVKNCLHQGYKLKKLSAKQREIFWNTLIFQNFDTNWTTSVDIKVSFSFIEFIKN